MNHRQIKVVLIFGIFAHLFEGCSLDPLLELAIEKQFAPFKDGITKQMIETASKLPGTTLVTIKNG